MIHLAPEVRSGLGEDTFWTWFARTFPDATFDPPQRGATVLQYSTLGAVPDGVRGIGLLWELYPEMRRVLGGAEWDAKIANIHECAASCEINVVPSALVASMYPDIKTTIIPIGVDFDLFRPGTRNGRGLWAGTMHPMKGYDILAARDPNCRVVWKDDPIPQPELARLMGESAYYAVPGRLRPYFLAEYEAMACDTPLRIYGELEKDFPPPDRPRDYLKSIGWDRVDVARQWREIV